MPPLPVRGSAILETARGRARFAGPIGAYRAVMRSTRPWHSSLHCPVMGALRLRTRWPVPCLEDTPQVTSWSLCSLLQVRSIAADLAASSVAP